MIVTTLNCRGLASLPKKLVVRRLVEDQFIDVLFLQEIMGDGFSLAGELELMLFGWVFISLDAKGKSGGLLLGWRIRHFQFLSAWAVDSGLFASLYSIEMKEVFCFMNIYGPYLDRVRFWNNLLSLECLKTTRLIFGGDLNFSLGCSEIWGEKAHVDSLSDFFSENLDAFGLVDVVPHVLAPTWSNRRVGNENICKRLDRLLVSAVFLDLDLHLR